MLSDRVSNPGPLTYESGALSIALHGPACYMVSTKFFEGLTDSYFLYKTFRYENNVIKMHIR